MRLESACELCNRGDNVGDVVATYAPTPRKPPPQMAPRPVDAQASEPPTLRVWRQGLPLLDEIVLSIVLSEAVKLSPALSVQAQQRGAVRGASAVQWI